MTQFRIGAFDRNKLSKPLRAFCPTESATNIESIDLQLLWDRGKRLILLDVDNTLTKWKSEQIDAAVHAWLNRARETGFQLALLSNTRHPARLHRLSALLDVPVIEGRMKPHTSMYYRALKEFNVTAEQAIMVGDQLMTDILGANRAGIDAIWLQPLSDHEFIGTKINRWLERTVVIGLHNAFIEPIDAEPGPQVIEAKKPFWERTLVKQAVKFCVVGVFSYAIDTGFSLLFVNYWSIGGNPVSVTLGNWLQSNFGFFRSAFETPKAASAPILFGLAAFLAMTNSFIWNRNWTFRAQGSEQRMRQIRRFYAISFIGLGLNSVISSAVFGSLHSSSAKMAVVLSKMVAAVVVAFWNFGGQRLYAFRSDPQH